MSGPNALYDTDAEIAVLGSMILDRDAYRAVAEIVQPSHFYHGPHADVFRAIDRLAQDDEAIDATLLAASMRKAGTLDRVGGTAFIVRVMGSVPSTANAVHYATLVRDLSKKRDLIAAADRYAAAARNGTEESEWKSLAGVREKLTEPEQKAGVAGMRWDLADQLDLPEPPPAAVLVERVFTRPSVNLVFGPPGSGKSFAVLGMALDLVCGGGAFLGHEEFQVKPDTSLRFDDLHEKCLWIYGSEDSNDRMNIRSRKVFRNGPHSGKPMPKDSFVWREPPPGAFLGDQRGWDWLAEVIETEKPTLLVLDTVSSLKTSAMKLNDNDAVAEFLRHFHQLRDHQRITTILNHHSRKSSGDPKAIAVSKADSMLGAQAWRSLSDGLVLVHANDGDTDHVDVRVLKCKDIERPIPALSVRLDRPTGRFLPQDEEEPVLDVKTAGRPRKTNVEAVLALRALHPDGIEWKQVRFALDLTDGTWRNNSGRLQGELLTLGHTVVNGILRWGS